uniref:Uncharacterized protein n=1 Tax=Salix viminalis TaxID=40686 RepID=A0A6N2LTU7_SALVM
MIFRTHHSAARIGSFTLSGALKFCIHLLKRYRSLVWFNHGVHEDGMELLCISLVRDMVMFCVEVDQYVIDNRL